MGNWRQLQQQQQQQQQQSFNPAPGQPPLPPLPLPATLLAAHSTPFSTISVRRVQRCGCGSNNISTAVARAEIHSKKYCLAL